jgi:hypothetical protein
MTTFDFIAPSLANELAKNLSKRGDETKKKRGNLKPEEDGPAGFGAPGKTRATRKQPMIRSPQAR